MTLPARAYTSPEVYERERREVFARSWVFACHASQVAEPGSYVAVDVAGEPVAVVRGADGELRALANVCRHRAMTILDGAGTCPKVLRCPYHGWTYRHDGQLAAVPEARGFEDLDREAVRLPAFRVGVLAGLVFVCLDPDTEPLETYFGDLEERLAPFRLAELRPLGGAGTSLQHYDHNWKVIADNYLEGYHIPVGHPGLLRLLDYKRYVATLGKRHSWIDGPLRDKRSANRLERLYQRLMQPAPGFPEAYRGSWTYVHLWPSTYLDIYPDMIDVWHTMPVSLGRTRSEWVVLAPPQEPRRNRLVRRVNMRINSLVMDEDVMLCDGVMRGLRSLTYERGVLNDNENAVWHFHEQLREHVPGIDECLEPSGST
jgi:Rieske 2Fe-2S family protein